MATEDTIMTAAEYSESVYQWLQQAHQWQALAVGKSQVFGILVYLNLYITIMLTSDV